MDDSSSRSSLRDRILNDVRSTVKQIYHESVNNELSPENKSYLCLTLIKNLDEALRHGLKQLHLGYWQAVQKILHPQTLEAVEKLPGYDGSNISCLTKGRTWIALSLRDDSFVSYIQCLSTEAKLDRFYETWSILRNNDSCNRFLSILSGLDNVTFTFEIDYFNKPPSSCSFIAKNITDENDMKPKSLNLLKNSMPDSVLISPVDSGVHIQDSSSDTEHDKATEIDFINGNVPESVILRKRNKDTKRHVSFHEDIIYKSPEKCRKLKWDHENLRYSWSGEELDSSILVDSDFSEMKSQIISSTPSKVMDINERGTPEGEETPLGTSENMKKINKSHKSIIVKRFLQSIKKQSKIKQLSKKYSGNGLLHPLIKAKIDVNLVRETNEEIRKELSSHVSNQVSKYEILLNSSIIRQMIKFESIYKAYQLRDYLFIITNASIYLISKNLHTQKINLSSLWKVVIYPDSQMFILMEYSKKLTVLVTGDKSLTDELMGRLELSMRRNHLELPRFYFLEHNDLRFLRKKLIEKFAIGKTDYITYYGTIRFEKENDLLDSSAPTWKRGFLMYRDVRNGGNWVPGDILLKGEILYLYADGHKLPKLAINLSTSCRSCSRTQNPERPHTFQITLMEREIEFQSESNCFYEDGTLKPKDLKSDTRRLLTEIRHKVNQLLTLGNGDDNSCTMEFAAADEYDMSDWLQMIIQASCGDCCEDASKDDIVDGTLLLTTDSLIIYTEHFSSQYDIEVLSCAQLCDIASFKIGESRKDVFTVIEFMCMEASSTSGDWILYMNSRDELDRLISALQTLWTSNAQFPICYINEDRLISKCTKTQDRLFGSHWDQLIE